MRRKGRLACLVDRGFTPGPRTRRLDRTTWPVILRVRGSEQRKDMFGAVRSPTREQAVVSLVKQATAVDNHETWIPTPRVLSHPRHNSSSFA
jgi:hypothetical protein